MKPFCNLCETAIVALPAFGAGILVTLVLPPLGLVCVCAGASVAFGVICYLSK